MAEQYGEIEAQRKDDPPWLADCARNGWVALSKDVSMLRRQPGGRVSLQLEAIEGGRVPVFLLMSQKIAADEQIARFRRHERSIMGILAGRDGPYVYGIYADGMREVWPSRSKTTHRPDKTVG
jgi:hypothetical protein